MEKVEEEVRELALGVRTTAGGRVSHREARLNYRDSLAGVARPAGTRSWVSTTLLCRVRITIRWNT